MNTIAMDGLESDGRYKEHAKTAHPRSGTRKQTSFESQQRHDRSHVVQTVDRNWHFLWILLPFLAVVNIHRNQKQIDLGDAIGSTRCMEI